MEWAILEDLNGDEAIRAPLLPRRDVVWGVSLDGLSLPPSLVNEDEVEAVEPEVEEVRDEEESPILPRGGRGRSGAGKRTLFWLLSVGAGILSPQHRRETL